MKTTLAQAEKLVNYLICSTAPNDILRIAQALRWEAYDRATQTEREAWASEKEPAVRKVE